MTQDISAFGVSGQRLLGRSAPAYGAVEEIRIGYGLLLKDGVLTFSTASLVPFGTKNGFVPGTASTTTDFLRADGQWVSDLTPINIIASGSIEAANFSGSSHGRNTGDQTIRLKGALTGSGTSDIIAGFAPNAVEINNLAKIPPDTLLGRATSSTGNVEIIGVQTLRGMLKLQGVNTGDQTITLTGDIIGSGTSGISAQIGANKVTLDKLEKITPGIIGRTSGKGNPAILSGSEVASILPLVRGEAAGIVPAPLEASGRFFRDDGTWSLAPSPEPVWGTMTGSIFDQADLVDALSKKIDATNPILHDPTITGSLKSERLVLQGREIAFDESGFLRLPALLMEGKAVATTDLLLNDAGSSVNLILLGDTQHLGNSISVVSESLFNSGAATLQRYSNAAAISARPANSGSFYVGLTVSNTPTAVSDLAYAFHGAMGQLSLVNHGTSIAIGSYKIGDILLVHHDGVSVRFIVNGEQRGLIEGKQGKLWRGQIMLGDGAISDIQFEAQDDVSRFNMVNLLHNGDAQSGDRSGWRNTSLGLAAGVKFSVSSESRSSGQYSFSVTKSKQVSSSITSRGFNIGGGGSYGIRFRARGVQRDGIVMARIWTSDTLDENGYVAGQRTSQEAGSISLMLQWTTSEAHVIVPEGHTYGAIEIIGNHEAGSFFFDDVSVIAASPFIPTGYGSPEQHATNGDNLITNAFMKAGDNGLLGYRTNNSVIRVKGTIADRAEYHLWARDEAATIYLNHTDSVSSSLRYSVTGEQMLCGAYIKGEAVFRLECFNNAGLALGNVSAVLTDSAWKWSTAVLRPLTGTTAVQIVIQLAEDTRIAYPYLRYGKLGPMQIEGGEDALTVQNDGQTLSVGMADDGVARIKHNSTSIIEVASSGLHVVEDIIVEKNIRKNNSSISLDNGAGAMELSAIDVQFRTGSHLIASMSSQGLKFDNPIGDKVKIGNTHAIGALENTLYVNSPESFVVNSNGQETFQVGPADVRHNGLSIKPLRSLQGFHKGSTTHGDILFARIAPYDMRLSPSRCVVRSTIASSSGVLLILKKNNISIGSIAFKPNGTLGEVTLTETMIRDGDLITVNASATEVTLANIAFLLRE